MINSVLFSSSFFRHYFRYLKIPQTHKIPWEKMNTEVSKRTGEGRVGYGHHGATIHETTGLCLNSVALLLLLSTECLEPLAIAISWRRRRRRDDHR